MLKLFLENLDPQRLVVWKELINFKQIGILGGGTALSLQLNHRRSFDFDIFSQKAIPGNLLIKTGKIFKRDKIRTVVDSSDELTLFIDSEIKITFIYFPFSPLYKTVETLSLDIFDIRDLLSNKAYVVGRRGTWRDYADLYWALSHKIIDLEALIKETKKKFEGNFNEKLFLEQLTYYEDINDWTIDWIKEESTHQEIKKFFKQAVSEYLSKKKIIP